MQVACNLLTALGSKYIHLLSTVIEPTKAWTRKGKVGIPTPARLQREQGKGGFEDSRVLGSQEKNRPTKETR